MSIMKLSIGRLYDISISLLATVPTLGSNSSAASNPGAVIHNLSWKFVSTCSFHYISMEAASHAQTFLYGL